MPNRVTPEFYWSEAERLLRLAFIAKDGAIRVELLEMASRFRQMSTQLRGEQADLANANFPEIEESEIA